MIAPKQCAAILGHLSHPGADPVSAARMARVPLRDFEALWKRGRADAEAGQSSDAADFYLSAQEAIATTHARLIAESHVAAGTRESDDLRKLAEYTSERADPFTGADEVGDIRGGSPQLNLADRAEAEDDPEEKQRMQAALRDGEQGLYSMFEEVLRQEARSRAEG